MQVLVEATQYDLVCQVSPLRIARSVRLIQAYELRFWDTMEKAAGLN